MHDPNPPAAPPITNSPAPTTSPTPQKLSEPWQEFLEDDADCCGGCDHKPR